jgi:hypothetical protein
MPTTSPFTETAYAFYVFLSIAMTIWVARTLHKNGRIFLVDAMNGHEKLADSVNHLLVVGFYLVNIGFVSLFLKYGAKPGNWEEAIEFLSTKMGIVLLTLGAMHFMNIIIFSKARSRALLFRVPPPVEPDGRTTVLT